MSQEMIFWLGMLVVMIIIEALTMGLTTIWFAGGALIAVLVAWLGGPIWLQGVLFLVCSLVLLFLTRPIAVRYFNKERVLTNAESMVGCRGIVISEIDNLQGVGQVNVKGQEWSARSEMEGVVIPKGAIVTVLAISGVKLIVKLDESLEGKVDLKPSEGRLDPRYIEEEASRYDDGK